MKNSYIVSRKPFRVMIVIMRLLRKKNNDNGVITHAGQWAVQCSNRLKMTSVNYDNTDDIFKIKEKITALNLNYVKLVQFYF